MAVFLRFLHCCSLKGLQAGQYSRGLKWKIEKVVKKVFPFRSSPPSCSIRHACLRLHGGESAGLPTNLPFHARCHASATSDSLAHFFFSGRFVLWTRIRPTGRCGGCAA